MLLERSVILDSPSGLNGKEAEGILCLLSIDYGCSLTQMCLFRFKPSRSLIEVIAVGIK